MASQEDFVRNYAEKRAAQMERARSLREQREAMSRPAGGGATPSYGAQQQPSSAQNSRLPPQPSTSYQQTPPSSLAPRGGAAPSYDYPPPVQQQQYGGYQQQQPQPQQYNNPAPVAQRPRATEPTPMTRSSQPAYQQQQQAPPQSYLQPPQAQQYSYARDDQAAAAVPARSSGGYAGAPQPVRSAPGPMTNGDAILVSETDFRRAVSLGVISSDQARQLWTIVSSGGSAQPPQMRPAPAPQYQAPPREQPQPYDAHNYASAPLGRDASDDYGTSAPPARAPGAGITPSRASKPQIKSNTNDWNGDFAEATNGDGGFGAPPPVPGRRPPAQQQSKKEPAAPASRAIDVDSMPVGRRGPPEKDPYADAYPPGFGQPPAQAQKQQQQQQQPTLAPGAASRAAAGRRGPASSKAPPPPPEPTPQEPDEDELAEFLRQKEEAAARLQQELAEAEEALDEEMIECTVCGRRFRESIIARHQKACKISNKKRRVFDTKAQRLDIEGAEVIQQAARAAKTAAPKQSAVAAARAAAGMTERMPKWQVQHEQLQAAMAAVRNGRGSGGGGGGGGIVVAAPPPAAPDDRVPCPHCNRKFAEDVAERHIPKCKTTLNRPKAVGAVRR